jgi:hypothetical protein
MQNLGRWQPLGTQSMEDALSILQSFAAELEDLRAEAMGWIPLDNGAYIHQGGSSDRDDVIEVVGLPDLKLVGMNVLLLV